MLLIILQISLLEISQVAFQVWQIWLNRNAVDHGSNVKDPLSIVSNSLHFFHEFSSAKELLRKCLVVNPSHNLDKWCKPLSLMVKVNCDASVRGNGLLALGILSVTQWVLF